jgi:16S rRNA (cytosine1402-N4)-methyltransferase
MPWEPTWREALLAEQLSEEMPSHDPVMVEEVLQALALQPGQTVIDGTLGLGGHTLRFIDAVSPEGVVLGLDWDEAMLALARERLDSATVGSVKLITRHADFRSLARVAAEEGLSPSGILLDLGLNSAQVDDPARGFSFLAEGPLDMRMDRTKGEPAAALLNRLSPFEIETLLFEFGDERWARAIAKTIVSRRREAPLRTTRDLVECVLAAVPPRARETRIHPATRTFQAIRIAANRELEGLREALLDAANCLAPGGTLAVLTYHSGEDRIVKTAFRTLAEEGFDEVFKKPLVPTSGEVTRNRRSRSAKLRAIRRHSG